MSSSFLTEEEKKQYIFNIIVGVLMERFVLNEKQAEQMIAASSLQRMLDDGHADYVFDSDEEYWIAQIVETNKELRAVRRCPE